MVVPVSCKSQDERKGELRHWSIRDANGDFHTDMVKHARSNSVAYQHR